MGLQLFAGLNVIFDPGSVLVMWDLPHFQLTITAFHGREEQGLAHLATSCNIHAMRYQIDGSRFATLEGFYGEVGRVLIRGESWGRNLDAFSDVLRGGFGTPTDGFTIEWNNHAVSIQRLGYGETVRQLEIRLGICHPSNRDRVLRDLERARAHQGPTVFDWLVAIIRIHGQGGQEEDDGVELLLD